jgi:hydroxymethylbilane synthase
MTQSQWVADAISASMGVTIELVVISTRGDKIQDKPLPEIGGKGLFTLELEQALREGRIDFAVHSLKDLPTDDPEGIVLGAIPQREDPRDALIGGSPADLPSNATVGSGSLRRKMQLQAIRPDLNIVDIRGNVPTRLAKKDDGVVDATVLALAGLSRLGIDRDDIFPIPVETMVPAVGQGALGVQCRASDTDVLALLETIDHELTRLCVSGERAFLAELGGGCNVPAGCYIEKEMNQYRIRAVVGGSNTALNIVDALGEDPIQLGLSAAAALK